MTKTIFYSVLISLLTITHVFCQNDFKPGYIITNEFDTINGFINLRLSYLNNSECEFRQQENGASHKYYPSDIFGYRIEDYKFFISKEIEINEGRKWVFLEFLVKGKANLYYFKDSLNDTYFIEKDSLLSQLEKIETEFINKFGDDKVTVNNKYKGTLSYLFQDASGMASDIQTTSYSMRDFVKVTKAYHNNICEGEACIDYTKSLKVKLFLRPFAGIIQSTLKLETSGNIDKNIKPFFGANVVFSPKRLNYKFNFGFGANFSSNSFKSVFYNSLISTDRRYRMSLDYSVLRVPLFVEYILFGKNIQPFLSVGYNASFMVNSEWEVVQIYKTDPIEDYFELPTHFSEYHHGIAGGGGIIFNLKNDTYFFLRVCYERRFPVSFDNEFLDHHLTSSVFYNLGYALRLSKK